MIAILRLIMLSALAVITSQAWGYIPTTASEYGYDLLGSPAAAIDSTGQVVWREEYKPYGERTLRQDQNTNALWYTGKVHEDALGLSYYGARWYDPELGRFTGIDPVDVDENNPHTFNRYAYANNHPYKYTDPDGKSALAIELGKDGAIVGTVACGPICGGVLGVVGVASGLYLTKEAIGYLSENSNDDGGSGNDKQEDKPQKDAKDQVKKLTKNEIKKLKKGGEDIHDLKGGKSASKRDLFKDGNGSIDVRPKNGDGPGDPTGLNINDF